MDSLTLQDVMERYQTEHKAALINDGLIVGFVEEGEANENKT